VSYAILLLALRSPPFALSDLCSCNSWSALLTTRHSMLEHAKPPDSVSLWLGGSRTFDIGSMRFKTGGANGLLQSREGDSRWNVQVEKEEQPPTHREKGRKGKTIWTCDTTGSLNLNSTLCERVHGTPESSWLCSLNSCQKRCPVKVFVPIFVYYLLCKSWKLPKRYAFFPVQICHRVVLERIVT
jgi:hypothetical protein